jgi:hypothetical protein
VTRRANLPGAAELFRVTGVPTDEPEPGRAGAGVPDGSVPAGDPPAPVPLRRADAAPVPRSGGASPASGTPRAPNAPPVSAAPPAPAEESGATRRRQPSGRERHDEKITVYISPDELHDLEHARLVLRREHGVRADRGRLVRVALALVLADLEARGEDSDLVRRLREQ